MSGTFEDISNIDPPIKFQTYQSDLVPVIISIFEMDNDPDNDKLLEERHCDWSDRETRKWFLFKAGKAVRTKQYLMIEPYIGPMAQFKLYKPGMVN